MITKRQNRLEHSPGKSEIVSEMFQAFLPNYWAVSRGGEWVQRCILKSYPCNISNILDNQQQATISMSCFINNQYHHVQGLNIFLIFVTLR